MTSPWLNKRMIMGTPSKAWGRQIEEVLVFQTSKARESWEGQDVLSTCFSLCSLTLLRDKWKASSRSWEFLVVDTGTEHSCSALIEYTQKDKGWMKMKSERDSPSPFSLLPSPSLFYNWRVRIIWDLIRSRIISHWGNGEIHLSVEMQFSPLEASPTERKTGEWMAWTQVQWNTRTSFQKKRATSELTCLSSSDRHKLHLALFDVLVLLENLSTLFPKFDCQRNGCHFTFRIDRLGRNDD